LIEHKHETSLNTFMSIMVKFSTQSE